MRNVEAKLDVIGLILTIIQLHGGSNFPLGVWSPFIAGNPGGKLQCLYILTRGGHKTRIPLCYWRYQLDWPILVTTVVTVVALHSDAVRKAEAVKSFSNPLVLSTSFVDTISASFFDVLLCTASTSKDRQDYQTYI